MDAEFPFSYITFCNDEGIEYTLAFNELESEVPNLYEDTTTLATYLSKNYTVSSANLDKCQLTLKDSSSIKFLSQRTIDCLLDDYGWEFVEDYIREVDSYRGQDQFHALLTYQVESGEALHRLIDNVDPIYCRNTKDFVESQAEGSIPDYLVVDWDESAENFNHDISLIVDSSGNIYSDFSDDSHEGCFENFYVIMTY